MRCWANAHACDTVGDLVFCCAKSSLFFFFLLVLAHVFLSVVFATRSTLLYIKCVASRCTAYGLYRVISRPYESGLVSAKPNEWWSPSLRCGFGYTRPKAAVSQPASRRCSFFVLTSDLRCYLAVLHPLEWCFENVVCDCFTDFLLLLFFLFSSFILSLVVVACYHSRDPFPSVLCWFRCLRGFRCDRGPSPDNINVRASRYF